MSARPQADWHEMEPLYSLSPQHDTTRPLDPPPRPAKSALTLYAPEMREPGGIRIGKPGWESTIGARWTPPLPPQMSEEAIKVQAFLLPRPPAPDVESRLSRWCHLVAFAILVGVGAAVLFDRAGWTHLLPGAGQ